MNQPIIAVAASSVYYCRIKVPVQAGETRYLVESPDCNVTVYVPGALYGLVAKLNCHVPVVLS